MVYSGQAAKAAPHKRNIPKLKTNVGSTDRILRVVLGAGLLIWFFLDNGSGPWHYAKLIGLVPLLTGLMSSCPLYSLFGMNTCPMKR